MLILFFFSFVQKFWRVSKLRKTLSCPCLNGGIGEGTIKGIAISNSNWTEWSTIQRVIVLVISKSDEREARGRFEITNTITL